MVSSLPGTLWGGADPLRGGFCWKPGHWGRSLGNLGPSSVLFLLCALTSLPGWTREASQGALSETQKPWAQINPFLFLNGLSLVFCHSEGMKQIYVIHKKKNVFVYSINAL